MVWVVVAWFCQQFHSMKKTCLRIVTGQPELVRICHRAQGVHDSSLLAKFFLCVAASKTLKSFRTQYWDLLPAASSATAACQATQTASDVAATKVALLQAKKLQPHHIPPAALSALTFCIASRVQLRALCSRLHQLQKAPVSTQDARCSLRLQVLRQIGTWSEWGFQGKDPCTDFRGSGQLGLECLYAMQQSIPDTVLRLLNESRDDQTAYPFACAVINVTHRCSAALHLGSLDAAMHAGDYQDVAFHRVVACATCRLHFLWRGSNPSSVMEFTQHLDRVWPSVLAHASAAVAGGSGAV